MNELVRTLGYLICVGLFILHDDFTAHAQIRLSGTYSPDGTMIAVTTEQGDIIIYTENLIEVTTLVVLPELTEYQELVKPVLGKISWSPDGNFLAANALIFESSEDIDVRLMVWDLSNWQQIHNFQRFGVEYDWSPDSTRIAATRLVYPQIVNVYDILSGNVLYEFTPAPNNINHLSWSPVHNSLLLINNNREFILWELETGPIGTIPFTASGQQATFSPDGTKFSTMVITNDLAEFQIWDAVNYELLQTLPLTTFVESGEGTWLKSGFYTLDVERNLLRWDIDTGQAEILPSPLGYISSWKQDGSAYIVIDSSSISVIETKTGQTLARSIFSEDSSAFYSRTGAVYGNLEIENPGCANVIEGIVTFDDVALQQEMLEGDIRVVIELWEETGTDTTYAFSETQTEDNQIHWTSFLVAGSQYFVWLERISTGEQLSPQIFVDMYGCEISLATIDFVQIQPVP